MREVIVIGGGVAGLQAAVFTAKAGLDTLVLDGGDPLVRSTDRIQNLLTGERIAGLANTWEYQTAVALDDGARAAVNLVSDRRGEAYVDHDW